MPDPGPGTTFWQVRVTVAGAAEHEERVRAALERLADEHPFLLEARYSADRAEVSYWEEGVEAADVAAMAARLWQVHRASADLPDWQVVGLEVVERAIVHLRETPGHDRLTRRVRPARRVPAGRLRSV